jgi:uncharacterized protein YacL
VIYLLKKILRALFTIVGLILGYIIGKSLMQTEYMSSINNLKGNMVMFILFMIFCTLLIGFIMFLISPWITSLITSVMDYTEKSVQKVPASEILFGTVGFITGLIIASLIVSLFPHKTVLSSIIAIILAVVTGAVVADISIRKREELTSFFFQI